MVQWVPRPQKSPSVTGISSVARALFGLRYQIGGSWAPLMKGAYFRQQRAQ
jgi:hypothetical protein